MQTLRYQEFLQWYRKHPKRWGAEALSSLCKCISINNIHCLFTEKCAPPPSFCLIWFGRKQVIEVWRKLGFMVAICRHFLQLCSQVQKSSKWRISWPGLRITPDTISYKVINHSFSSKSKSNPLHNVFLSLVKFSLVRQGKQWIHRIPPPHKSKHFFFV